MINKLLSLLLIMSFTFSLSAQSPLDSELGFIYVKAEYLFDTDRYEDAIMEYSKIIDQDPAYKDALFKRASAKYAIAAFIGTKNDLLKSFEYVGITPESILLFGKAQKNLDEDEAASITMKTASMLDMDTSSGPTSTPQKEESKVETNNDKPEETTPQTTDNDEGNNPSEGNGELQETVKKIEDSISTILDDILDRGEDKTSGDVDLESKGQGNTGGNTPPVEEEPKEEVYVPDTSVNELYVDEDLTIFIRNGLGNRKILDQPNILILSETSGEVAVDVCVNRNGKVTSAEFNKDASTLNTQSLVSLAVRKSKEFWFEKSDRAEICGRIIFKITGRT